MERGTGISEPLLVNGFLATAMKQSTASTSLTNILSVSFRARYACSKKAGTVSLRLPADS